MSKSVVNKIPFFTILIIFLCGLCFLFPSVASILIFDREAVLQGEIWRFFSSHFVHFTGIHLAYNLLAFGAAGWIVERKNSIQFCILYALLALAIGMSLFILRPAMIYYGGLSGIAYGFIYYGALVGLAKPDSWRTICKLIIIFLPLKIFLEIYFSNSILPYWGQQTFVIMPLSHVTGIVVAFLFYAVVKIQKRHSNKAFHLIFKSRLSAYL